MVTKTDQRARLRPRGYTSSGRGSGGSQFGQTFGSGRGASSTDYYSLPFEGPGAPLRSTNGILFPYTPNISVAHSVDYIPYEVVHTNYQQNAYSKTRNPTIQITGMFAATTQEEAAYMVGAMHFLRVMTKMNFGANDPDAGTPPPVCEFTAYGAYNFQKVPVVIGSFNFNYEDGVDYVEVETAGEIVQVPSLMTIAIDLLPQYSPSRQNNFRLTDFARGRGYKDGFI